MRWLVGAALLAAGALDARPAASSTEPVAPRAADNPTRFVAPALAPQVPAAAPQRSTLTAEVAYPRSREEAKALGSFVLLLVTATTTNGADLPLDLPTLHLADGRTDALLYLVGQTDDAGTELAGSSTVGFRYSALYVLPLAATAMASQISVVFGGNRQIVARFPRPASAYPTEWPAPETDTFSTPAAAAFAAKRYPFFRVPPLVAPDKAPTCPAHPLPPRAASAVERRSATNDRAATSEDGVAPSGDRRVSGSLPKPVIKSVIHAHLDEVRGCYESQLVKQKDLRGRVQVRFVIRRDGWVASSFLQSATLPNPIVSDCIVATVRCWRFPAPSGGTTVVVTYPFLFEPAATSP